MVGAAPTLDTIVLAPCIVSLLGMLASAVVWPNGASWNDSPLEPVDPDFPPLGAPTSRMEGLGIAGKGQAELAHPWRQLSIDACKGLGTSLARISYVYDNANQP